MISFVIAPSQNPEDLFRKRAGGAVEYLQQNPPMLRVAANGPTPTVSFTGILAQSPDLTSWADLVVSNLPQ